MLLLFDIDMTLLSTGGTGEQALTLAGREVFGETYTHQGLEVAGRLDRLIFDDMARLHGRNPTPALHDAVRDRYTHHLAAMLAGYSLHHALPGVHDLLNALRPRAVADTNARPELVLGVLTGNYERPGTMKLRACSIDPDQFVVQAWCDLAPWHAPKRADLVEVAIRQCAERTGRCCSGRDVVVLGDTPHDIACAHAHGCIACGVATGRNSLEELRKAGADIALPSFADTGQALLALGLEE